MAEQSEEERKKIVEDYNYWKGNAPLLYDMVITNNLTWPSLTCQWLPKRTLADGVYTQKIMIGTHTNDEEDNYVKFMDFNVQATTGDSSKRPKTTLSVNEKIKHDGEVNRARIQPHQPDIFATKTRDGDVLVFDKKGDENSEPVLRLKGHHMEGYGLAWNPHLSKKNHILSAGFDNLICHWDIEMTPNSDKELQPLQIYKGHTSCVEDISWNSANNRVFASVADDKQLFIWDCREPIKPVQGVKGHESEINSVAFHPKMSWMLATGGADKSIGLWDTRNLKDKLHSLEHHDGEVTQVAWSPHDDPIIASAATDRKIVVWDLRLIGTEQLPEDAEDGPPEVMFVHSGHTNRISDFSWNPSDRWVIASAAEDNVVQVWKMTRHIYGNKDYSKIDESLLE